MKKLIITSAIATLAFVSVAAASFDKNLSVGSTGSDVSALQTWLISKGFNIPAVAADASKAGYFGQQTKTAVMAYQKSVNVPATGFVGPLTRATLNGSPAEHTAMTLPFPCPAAYTAPAGWTCPGTTPVVVTPGTGTITTPGIPGTLIYNLQSTFNNSTLDKGKTVDVARYKLQASASDMQVSSLSFDVNKRLWLYVSAITLKDDAGNVIASKTGLTSSDFSELNVGDSYRLTLPLSYVVPRATSKYITINLTAQSATDRTSTDTITITSSQARAVDGTGVNDTQTDPTDRNVAWTGSSNAAIVTTIDSASPSTKLVQISTSVETDNVVLGVFDIKSQNTATMLRTLKVSVRTSGNTVNGLFNDIKLKIGGNTWSADSIDTASPNTVSSSSVTFTNLNTTLTKDTYVSVTVLGKVAKNVTGSASTTLYANATNIVVEDSSYAAVSVNTATIAANTQSFTTSGVVVVNPLVTKGQKTVTNAGTTTETFSLAFGLTAGDNPIYVAKAIGTAITATSSNTAVTITSTDFSVNDSNNDGATYFYIAPGQTKIFTATYFASANPESSTVFKITDIKAGVDSTTLNSIDLNSSDIQNALKATMF